MKNRCCYLTSFLLLALSTGAAAQDVTRTERDQALRYLDETRDGVVDAVKGYPRHNGNSNRLPIVGRSPRWWSIWR